MALYEQEIILSTKTNGQLTALQQSLMNKSLSEEWGIIEGGSNLNVRKSGSVVYVDRGYAYVGGHLVECEGTSFTVSGSSYYDVYLEINLNENYTGLAKVVVNGVANATNEWKTLSQENGKLLRLQLGIVTSSNNTVKKLANVVKKVGDLVQEINALGFDSGWIEHNTTSYYFNYNFCMFRKTGKVVELRILATAHRQVPKAGQRDLLTPILPVDFRPSQTVVYGIGRTNNNVFGIAEIKTNGGVQINFPVDILVGDFVVFNSTWLVD